MQEPVAMELSDADQLTPGPLSTYVHKYSKRLYFKIFLNIFKTHTFYIHCAYELSYLQGT